MAICAAALATWLVSRSITRPLRSLTRQAIDVAQRRLPSAVRSVLETPRGDEVVVVPGIAAAPGWEDAVTEERVG